jgi:hypothetical protein
MLIIKISMLIIKISYMESGVGVDVAPQHEDVLPAPVFADEAGAAHHPRRHPRQLLLQPGQDGPNPRSQ